MLLKNLLFLLLSFFLTGAPVSVPNPTPLPTPTPTPKPLTFQELNALYGPCVYLPTLMYHHIEDEANAKKEGHAGLTVTPQFFQEQLQYLQTRNYHPIQMQNLINFFDFGSPLPPKPILLTFDDGYADFVTYALPLLSGFHFSATLFLPSGLVNNPGYVTWDQIHSDLVFVANHTWSHHSMRTDISTITKEISTAQSQLEEHGFGNPRVFAFPYGAFSSLSQNYLSANNFKLAFTTVPGSILCKKKRFELPRVRIGNAPLSAYGL